ncbi:MAG: MFS transporter [Gammaproteobacteria bacterium]|nr:MFS transporter [Gammaproteobacteria bacterium]
MPAADSSDVHAHRRRLALMGVLGFASGLPLALSRGTLQAWLTVDGIDLAAIGALSLVGLPYLFKFLWAPALDRWQIGRLGRRRGWLLASQGLLVGLLAAFAACDPARAVWPLALLALLLACASATQDIAFDAYRAERLTVTERGLGTAWSIAGYRVAMLASGAGALVLADERGFAAAYLAMAALMLAGVAASAVAREPALAHPPPRDLREAVIGPLHEMAQRPAILAMLACVLLYKLGDQFAGALAQTFFIRGQGYSLKEIGAVYKGLGMIAALSGGILGGLAMTRLGLWRSLLVFGVLQMVTNAGFLALAVAGKSLPGLMAVVALENFCGGMGTCAHVALLIALCDARYTATQYAALSALAGLGGVVLGPVAAAVAAAGWVLYFAVSLLVALPGLALVLALRQRVQALDDVQSS